MPDKLNRIIHGDCIAGLEKLADGCVDLAFADPPFNIGYDYDEYDDKHSCDDYLEWSGRWMKEVVRDTGPENVEEFQQWCEYWKEHLKEVIEKLHDGWDDQHVSQETWQLVMELRRYCVRHDAEIFEDDPTVYPSPDLPSQETPGMSPEDALSVFRGALEWCMQNQPPDEKQKSKWTKAEANEAVREYLLKHQCIWDDKRQG